MKPLFCKAGMYGVIEAQRAHIEQTISSYNGNQLLNTPTEDLVTYFVQTCSIDPIVLDLDRAHVSHREASVQHRDHLADYRGYGSDYISVPGLIVTLKIPYSGDRQLFDVQPTTFDTAPPHAEVDRDSITFEVSGRNLTQEHVKQRIDSFTSSLQKYVGWQTTSINEFNRAIHARVHAAIEDRKKKLLANQSLVAALGFRLTERPDSSRTFAAPQVRRKIQPRPPAASSAPYIPEPLLDESHYQHILGVLQNMTAVFERSPSAFRTMDEESIRQHFLVHLNGHYEKSATGETFNFQGKTDILIREDGRNIFIGECKFWQGEKAYLATIDQVLSYLSWRDTKAAVIVFNRNKDFSKVLDSLREATLKHSNVKSGPKVEGETRFRYVFRSAQDASKELILTVMAFDVPV